MAKLRPYVFPIVMASMMSLIMSGIVTFRNLGPTPDFLITWLSAWVFAGPVAVTGVLLARPLVQRISDVICDRFLAA
ncbi:MAG: DUF2798 domain-containing protein [Pseudomonadota bacterium]